MLLHKAGKTAALPLGLLRPARTGDVVILTYHRVGTGSRNVDVTLAAFRDQMTALRSRGRATSLDHALASPDGGVVVTVDDGFHDFLEKVVPVLVEQRIPALLYLATAGVDGTNEALSWDGLRAAVATGLVTVGAHTHTHANLARASSELARQEMTRSKGVIEDRLQQRCAHFAYPWGVASAAAEEAAAELFDTAALGWGTNRRGSIDPLRLARLPVTRADGKLFFRAKVQGLMDQEALLYRAARRGPWRHS